MAHRLDRRAALTAAGLSTLLLGSVAGAQTPSNDFRQCSRYRQDDRHDSVYLPGGCFWTADPAARPGDVPTTGTLGTPGSGLPAAGIAGPGTVAVPDRAAVTSSARHSVIPVASRSMSAVLSRSPVIPKVSWPQ